MKFAQTNHTILGGLRRWEERVDKLKATSFDYMKKLFQFHCFKLSKMLFV